MYSHHWMQGFIGNGRKLFLKGPGFSGEGLKGLRGCLKSQRESQTIPMEWDNYRKIQYFGGPLAEKYTWDNPFQTTSH